ncbi:MAG: helicase [Deltaproteobacteria bacterium]|nr:helicase [Deltaproteobacteria bacterium]
MTDERFTAQPVLAGLKDFQRRTVDYVFERFYGENPTTRFLVADEVGLGKTLIARGLIARMLEHLQDTVDRIDVIYICSNAAIARQNANKLKVSGQREFALATRLTLLPLEVSRLASNKINFVSLTPGTTFDLKSRGGTAKERALIYRMLRDAGWSESRGLMNMLEGNVKKRGNWEWWANHWSDSYDRLLADAYAGKVHEDRDLVERLTACCQRFRQYRDNVPGRESAERFHLVGRLRLRLAQTCLQALEPDLVILDEFQRFRDLFDPDENNDDGYIRDEARLLAQELIQYEDVRTLLLSATPYKMLSLDHEQDDDHYPDFLRTLKVLCQDPAASDQIRRQIHDFRTQLFAQTSNGRSDIAQARDRLQASLLQVMCRTERVGMTRRLDAMLEDVHQVAPLHPEDLEQAATALKVARAVQARDPIEYWKSSPYLLSFLKNYELRRKIDDVRDEAPAELLEALKGSPDSTLNQESLECYEPISPASARIRALIADTLDRGLWRLLWMPPALPYAEPGGAYQDVGDVTKVLAFSSWNMVPDAIATICSYEAERRMIAAMEREYYHSELHRKLRPLLRFSKGADDRLTGMPTVAWMYPSPTLATRIDPLKIALENGDGSPLPVGTMREIAERQCEKLLDGLPSESEQGRVDESWYWAALALLDKNARVGDWLNTAGSWPDHAHGEESDSQLQKHLDHLATTIRGEMSLGPKPQDLPEMLALMALGSPGNCALRALRRVAPSLPPDDPCLLSGAVLIADGFRTLFNLPETIALLRGEGEASEASYWRLALHYAIDGNLQALLDEQVHILVEQLGLLDHLEERRVTLVAAQIAESLSIRTSQVRIDQLTASDKAIAHSSFNSRCRFALRFADLKGDQDKTLARADLVLKAFNSPFRPFVLASTSIGQEGLDFHTWCHAVMHWNLPSNPVDLEQREGRVHRYKGHAIRKNIAEYYGLSGLRDWDTSGDPWACLFARAVQDRAESESDLVPFWIFEKGSARIERRVPLIPFSREVGQLERLKKNLALYRLVFGQPRQEDLLSHLSESVDLADVEKVVNANRISLIPPNSNH